METLSKRFHEKFIPCPMTGCWLWTASQQNYGYGQIGVEAGKSPLRANRVAWMLYRGEIPDGMLVCHHCDVPSCVNPCHLFLGTRKDNSQDMVSKLRSVHGDRQGAHKLSNKDVLFIRSSNLSVTELSKKFGVSRPCIQDVIRRHTWKAAH